MTEQEGERPGKNALDPVVHFNCSVQQERQCVHMRKETHKCNMRTQMHAHTQARTHT